MTGRKKTCKKRKEDMHCTRKDGDPEYTAVVQEGGETCVQERAPKRKEMKRLNDEKKNGSSLDEYENSNSDNNKEFSDSKVESKKEMMI